MAYLTLQTFQISNWNWGGDTCTLRIFASQAFFEKSTGAYIAQGNVQNANSFYQSYNCTISAGIVSVPQVTLATTTDSSVPTAVYTAALFDENGVNRYTLLSQFYVAPYAVDGFVADPVLVNAGGTTAANGTYTYRGQFNLKNYYNLEGQDDSTTDYAIIWDGTQWLITDFEGTELYKGILDTDFPYDQTWLQGEFGAVPVPGVTAGLAQVASTWEALIMMNQGSTPWAQPLNAYWTIPQTEQYVNRYQSPLPHASSIIEGKTFLSADPEISTHPEAVGTNDPIWTALTSVRYLSEWSCDLTAALAEIGSTPTELIVTCSCTVSATTVVPATCLISMVGQGKFTVASGQTLTINRFQGTPLQQFFYGSGDVILGVDAVPVAYLDWWGATQAGLAKAITSFGFSARNKVLVISNRVSFASDANVTTPTNMLVQFTNEGGFDITTGGVVTIGKMFDYPSTQIFFGSQNVKFTNGAVNEMYAAWWGSDGFGLDAAITAIDSTVTTLVVTNNLQCSASFDPPLGSIHVPSNITVKFDGDGTLTADSGFDVQIDALEEPPVRQVFLGQGNIVLGKNAVTALKLYWWTGIEDSTLEAPVDNTHAFQQVLDSFALGGGSTCYVPLGYWFAQNLVVEGYTGDGNDHCRFIGEGRGSDEYVGSTVKYGSSIIVYDPQTANYLFKIGVDTNQVIFENISLSQGTDDFDGVRGMMQNPVVFVEVLTGHGTGGVTFDNCHFAAGDLQGWEITVAGAGTSAANGVYSYRGTNNGKGYWNLVGQSNSTTNSAIVWDGSKWILTSSAGLQLYKTTFDIPAPYDMQYVEGTKWILGTSGTGSAPTVQIPPVTTNTYPAVKVYDPAATGETIGINFNQCTFQTGRYRSAYYCNTPNSAYTFTGTTTMQSLGICYDLPRGGWINIENSDARGSNDYTGQTQASSRAVSASMTNGGYQLTLTGGTFSDADIGQPVHVGNTSQSFYITGLSTTGDVAYLNGYSNRTFTGETCTLERWTSKYPNAGYCVFFLGSITNLEVFGVDEGYSYSIIGGSTQWVSNYAFKGYTAQGAIIVGDSQKMQFEGSIVLAQSISSPFAGADQHISLKDCYYHPYTTNGLAFRVSTLNPTPFGYFYGGGAFGTGSSVVTMENVGCAYFTGTDPASSTAFRAISRGVNGGPQFIGYGYNNPDGSSAPVLALQVSETDTQQRFLRLQTMYDYPLAFKGTRFEYDIYRDFTTGWLNFIGTQTPATQYRGYAFDGQMTAPQMTSSDKLWSLADGSNNVGGIGYTKGTKVTQATDRSTAVTINKYSGQITTTANSIAAGLTVFFTVNNTTVLDGDNVTVCVAGETTVGNRGLGLMTVRVTTVYADHFELAVTNNDVAANTNTLIINFKVIKGRFD